MKAARPLEERFSAALDEALAAPELKSRQVRRIGLAVSGGSDSIALMRLAAAHCRARGIEPVVLCLDHAIEGENSAAEAAFVRRAARRLGLEARIGKADPPVRAANGKSLEMAAREARLAFFASAARECRLDAIATGHQRDDAAETLLLRLLRGAGATGLSGLRPVSATPGSGPVIVRPLLGFGRDELRAWLRRRRIRWMDDVSNSNLAIPRCRVRLSLVPEIARAMGATPDAVSRNLAQSAAILRDEDAVLDSLTPGDGARDGRGAFDLAATAKLPVALARRALRRWLIAECGADAAGFATVEAVLHAARGSSVNLPGGAILDIGEDATATLRAKPDEAPAPARLRIPGSVQWGVFTISAQRAKEVLRQRERPGEWPARCTISRDAVRRAGGLVVRARAKGEAMAPFGLRGTKSLQDIFVDLKIPSHLRAAWPVVATPSGIAWLPGYRVAAPFAVAGGDDSILLTIDMANR